MNYARGTLVTAAEMRAAEAAAVAGGVSEDALMEAAGSGLAALARERWPRAGTVVIFAGKGHNAGDAWVAARHWLEAGWRVEGRAVYPVRDWRPLTREKWLAVRDRITLAAPDAPLPPGTGLLVDALLGTGSRGPLRTEIQAVAAAMNSLRLRHGLETLAIDLPSGMDADSGAAEEGSVVADVTAALGFAKTGLAARAAVDCAGRLAVVPLPAVVPPPSAAARGAVIMEEDLRALLPRRAWSMHKGQAGRVGIVAGSVGLTGAARLASAAAAAAGAGLVTLFCPHAVWPVLAAACPPEVMVRPVHSAREIMAARLDAIGVGPGMGPAPLPYMADLLRDDPRPMVVDADALNAMAASGLSLADRAGGPRLLTPHPGELARLLSASGMDSASALAAAWDVVVLEKSARSVVHAPGEPPLYNTTGHPAMARGGMGDVLTGFCTAMLAQGLTLRDAAALGSWRLGRAGELAARDGSVSPEEVLRRMG